MKYAIFLILIGLFTLPAQAQLKDCSMYGGGAWSCYQEQRAAIARRLQGIEPRLRSLNADVADRFKISQRLWIRFTEADCRMESEPATVAQGSGYARVYEYCMAERYDQRLTDMEKLIQFLKR